MKIRRIKFLIANGWFKTVCMISYSLLSLFCSNASAHNQKDTLYIQERNQGMRARAYGPMYPRDNKPLLVLDGCIVDLLSVDIQCLDSISSGKLQTDKKNIARLFGIKERDIYKFSVLKDSAATAEWGFRGMNGVIEVVTKEGRREERRYGRGYEINKNAWESINEEIQEERSNTELNSLPGNGIYIPSDHDTYYSIEDLYNNWIQK